MLYKLHSHAIQIHTDGRSHAITSINIVLLFHVFHQGIFLQELAWTQTAFVHLFTSVYSTVLFVYIGSHELLATEFTLEWFITSVNDTMLPQIAA